YYGNLTREFAATLAPAGASNYTSTMVVATLRGALNELSWEIAQSVDPVTARHHALAIIDCLLSKACESPQVTHTGAIPDRIGIRQLRIDLGNYIDRVAAGETIDVTRRGRVVARLQQPTN
ncbi:type II toxin-antitoxin system Phd/YefM family antitoxin, partial [Mycobacterium sp. 1482292.6]|uniref:type II toxin-antitoxin system Phd/YefM family antitoxin n=1 Tax=Mycobacterium sp. 1482292.6 TaxID=1834081 RepID=UPI000A59BCFC